MYAYLPGTNIPLSFLGLIAYSATFLLSIGPLVLNSSASQEYDTMMKKNRLVLTSLTTSMGMFSIVLISFLIFIMKESCLYCLISAICSITLTTLAWMGNTNSDSILNTNPLFSSLFSSKSQGDDILNVMTSSTMNHFPSEEEKIILQSTSWSSGIVSFLAGVFLLTSTYITDAAATGSSSSTAVADATSNNIQSTATTLVVGSDDSGSNRDNKNDEILLLQAPPAITTSSSERSIQLAQKLQSLSTKFYGAYWCSHCYEQKQTLGIEAMSYIPYIECSKDGFNSNNQLCRTKKIPGYPTWEINNEFYPGERSIEELEEIVELVKITSSSTSTSTIGKTK
jgi:uncharacterized membrane protein